MIPDELLDFVPSERAARERKGLIVVLSETCATTVAAKPAVSQATPEPLAEEDARRILSRLEALPAAEEDVRDFAFPPRALLPPQTGARIAMDLSAEEIADEPPVAEPGELEILSFSPAGNVELAPQLTIVFSRPMVDLSSRTVQDRQEVPARLSPQPEGRWRWLDTRTLIFELPERFPMATEYTVEIPAGTQARDGAALPAACSWTFATPAPRLVRHYPSGESNPSDPLLFLGFEQKIEPEQILPHVTTKGQKSQPKRAVRLATDIEIQGDQAVKKLVDEATPGTWLVARPCEPLSRSTKISVTVEAGAIGREGPLPTKKPQGYSFNTAGPFTVTKHEVGSKYDSGPHSFWTIEFSNPVDQGSLDETQILIEPELPHRTVEVGGRHLWIHGASSARTTYRLTLPASLCDTLGQGLEGKRILDFEVGSPNPALSGVGRQHIVLDPQGPPVFLLYTVNHAELLVRLYAVTPDDWAEFQHFLSQRFRKPNLTPPGTLVYDATVRPDERPDEEVETRIDLSPALRAGFGHVIVSVIPKLWRKPDSWWETICTWAQVTQIGLTAVSDGDELVAWASSLQSGTPRQARIELLATDAATETSEDGLARLRIPEEPKSKNRVLVARCGDDVAFLSQERQIREQWQRQPAGDELLWYVFNDRGVYRPGETARFHGWLRRRTGTKTSDVRRIEKAVLVRHEVYDGKHKKVSEGRVKIEPDKGFELSFDIPKEINTGRAGVFLRYPGVSDDIRSRSYTAEFLIEEYRRPEYEVTLVTSDGPYMVGSSATATATAAYYAGGPLQSAEVRWQVSCESAHFTPPGREDYAFGRWRPFWFFDHGDDESYRESFSGITDNAGRHGLKLDFQAVDPPYATIVRVGVSVTDINRQEWSASNSLLVHPAELYVGLRCHRTFIRETEGMAIDVIACDLEGKLLTGQAVDLRICRITYDWKDGVPSEAEHLVQSQRLTSTHDPLAVRIEGLIGGEYRLTATTRDSQGRATATQVKFWVAGGTVAPQRTLEGEDLELIPSKREYEPGDTAEVLVRSAFSPAQGLVTIARAGIVRTDRFSMNGPTHTLAVPISEDDYPNVNVQVDLIGTKPWADSADQISPLPPQPAYATGQVQLSVPPRRRGLRVTAVPQRAALEPGSQTELEIEIRDVAGNPRKCDELAVVIADEAVLALSNYDLADPLEVMYPARSPVVSHDESRKNLIERRERKCYTGAVAGTVMLRCAAAGESADSMLADFSPRAYTGAVLRKARALTSLASIEGALPIQVRKDFNPVALFLGGVTTDEHGRARVPVKLPDSLTRYRVMVVAAAGENLFGKGEATITARLPLMVRPSPPRFLNFGDSCELPVVVQNQQDTPLEVAVAVGTTNLELPAGAGRVVSVPPGDRVEVCFPIASVHPGTARFQVAAVSANGQDAARGELPVWTPASTEATAIYGQIDEGAVRQGLAVPPEVVEQFGGLEISTSSTAVAALTDAVLYLVKYPFECAEQLASRLLAVAALRDVLGAFQAKGLPKPQRIELAVKKDIELLRMMQNVDGGFGFWRRGDPSWPFLSLHVPHALARAKEKGYAVPVETIGRSLKYLKDIRRHISRYECRDARWALEAYAIAVRARLGDTDLQAAIELLDAVGLKKLPLEASGWLLGTLAQGGGDRQAIEAILRHLENRAAQTAATAHFTTAYADGAHLLLHSDRRADAIILESLITVRPEHPLIPKLVHGLLAHRIKGRWRNTQESAFVLLALDRCFRTYEAQTPDFVARVWLGERFAAEHEYRGRTTEQAYLSVPMTALRDLGSRTDVVLAKDGPGRMYYRLGLDYVPAKLQLDAENCGFQVSRTYQAIGADDDVRRSDDGVWHIRAGAQVRVRLELVAPSRRYHVALVDPLPAGLEPLNPALAVTPEIDLPKPRARTFIEWWKEHWFNHQNLRDDRVEVFSALLWEGVYEYEYTSRATTRGNFIVPPTRAEEMYHPETFGRSRSDRVIVE